MERAALISVSNKEGLIPFAEFLIKQGFILLSTSGTCKALQEAGLAVLKVEDYTGQPEILDGRVKTLHPKIHAGILARRDIPNHLKQIEQSEIIPIDLVVVNLYPFIDGLKSESASDFLKMEELIDVGGPTMIRAAAKNYRHVLAVIDPSDYQSVQQILSDALSPQDSLAQRRKLAAKVFASLSYYDSKIALYLSEKAGGSPEQLADDVAFRLTKRQSLRYGENPHQRAAYYQAAENSDSKDWEQLQGKELSYNNLLDFDAALKIIKSFSSEKYAVAIIKHLNPCGAAVADSLGAALANAKKGDPRSHFGGIIALNAAVSAEVARLIGEDFAELVIAPEFEDAAMNIFSARKNLRVIRANLHSSTPFEIRTAAGGVLLQEPDLAVSKAALATVASKVRPSEAQLLDLQMAWVICSHVKSNAIVIAKNQTIIGVGAGQMSRIDSAELAISRARLHGHDLRGAVAASDAFFPFPDSIELLAEAGIRAVIAPSGAKRDADAVLAADRAGIALIFAADRHFRH